MKYFFKIILIVLLYSCNNSSEKKVFFSQYKDLGVNAKKVKILSIDSAFVYNNNPAYKFEFNSWQGVIINDRYIDLVDSLRGYLFEVNNKVYFAPTINNTNGYLLFDFDMNIGDQKQYEYPNGINKIVYNIELENKFFSTGDTIYKFKFKDVGIFNDGLDLICYVDKYKGVLGMYLSYYSHLKKEDEIYSETGQIYDYFKLKHFKGNVQ